MYTALSLTPRDRLPLLVARHGEERKDKNKTKRNKKKTTEMKKGIL